MVIGGSAFATLYPWPENKRPPISLDRAFAVANKALREKMGKAFSDYYCTQAGLTGTKAQDGSQGAWYFKFRTEAEGSMGLYVTVYMNGSVFVQDEMKQGSVVP